MLAKLHLRSGDFYSVVVPPREDGEHDLQICLWQVWLENPMEVPTLTMDGEVLFRGRFTSPQSEEEDWCQLFDAVSDMAAIHCDCR